LKLSLIDFSLHCPPSPPLRKVCSEVVDKDMTGRARYSRNGERGYGRDGVLGNGEDCSTFFFSNFPNGYGELDMTKVFQKWATVKEVFISRRPNKWGRRFGFVRFLDVKNVVRLEGDLDRIYIGTMKLHVNIPKYRRHQYEPRREC